jgi:hypothetical protein
MNQVFIYQSDITSFLHCITIRYHEDSGVAVSLRTSLLAMTYSGGSGTISSSYGVGVVFCRTKYEVLRSSGLRITPSLPSHLRVGTPVCRLCLAIGSLVHETNQMLNSWA